MGMMLFNWLMTKRSIDRLEPEQQVAMRPLFRPLGEWHVSPRPQLNASDYQRRKTMRELEMAFTTRSVALHRHGFD
jgi:hypothetical protein